MYDIFKIHLFDVENDYHCYIMTGSIILLFVKILILNLNVADIIKFMHATNININLYL